MSSTRSESVSARTPETETASDASTQEKFAMLYGMLKETQEWLFDFEFKQGTFLLIILGWIVSSVDAQAFFEAHLLMQIGMTVLMIGLTTFHAVWVTMHYKRSVAVHGRLVELDYVPADYYRPQLVPQSLALSFVISHLLISVVIILAVWLS